MIPSAPLITPQTGERCASFELAAHPGSAAQARRLTRAQLDGWSAPEETCEAAILIVSELVTNALVHTGSRHILCELREIEPHERAPRPSPDPLRRAGGASGPADGARLRIAVRDEGQCGRQPASPRQDPQDEHGRGLFLVSAMSLSWGTQEAEQGSGLVVWAELSWEEAR
ncbi:MULTISPECIES: ATP-binding protein [unclassified Streptomyces]|uniref:ATP-binding protein n=1 Tax=Streptomyces evansiae TaxID=3075535 RepID=A0ABD5E6Z0_9ACTN|nr:MULTISPECIES: ATP-binding protein [unclassified Streptomyces]MYQ60761.1 ATP-binding protein [Streptomyces sp. SID4926]MYX24669.1 ATP-binding protein [Streptomyces sp. SID8380]ASY35509.1 ATP-binding protein [Streptomyces sp. CLI2509]MDT0409718.1 ATP-binding protein [Streptomyces sp. DSM 41979]MDT0417186.1 ATP-binding protein [Streptomyces sp. DSM 41982]